MPYYYELPSSKASISREAGMDNPLGETKYTYPAKRRELEQALEEALQELLWYKYQNPVEGDE